jgi:hypothetical protein
MKIKFIFKAFFLLLALTATLYSIYLLDTGHMGDFWTSLGIGNKGQSLIWCSSRVTQLEDAKNKGWMLEEKNQQWQITKLSDTKNLNYLDLEKWLAKYCTLEITIYNNPDILDMHLEPFAVARFNDGTSAKIYTLGDKNIFQINEVIFQSREFEQALQELKDLLKI